jgi:hypothetical protein
MSKTQTLTLREKAACALYVLEKGRISQVELYGASTSNSLAHFEGLSSPDSAASRWLNSDKVQRQIREFRSVLDDMRTEIMKDVEQEVLSRKPGKDMPSQPQADYSNPRAREALYNSIISRSTDDPKTQLDAAKMFEQIQKDNREAAATHQKHVRYYLPLRCESCVLYRKAKDAREKQVK